MPVTHELHTLVVFPSSLGWMAIISSGSVLKGLTFAHRSPQAARAALARPLTSLASPDTWQRRLVARLQAYASGEEMDFRDVRIDAGLSTDFQRRVVHLCRQIPWGKTLTYGQLAASAGRPGAARAVGNRMAANRLPLVVPCHRVVAADGRLGGFSAPGGVRLKRRLLDLESACCEAASGAVGHPCNHLTDIK